MDILTGSKIFGLQIAILFFLVSFLVNLLQRRYSKARLNRMLRKEESVVNFLGGIQKYLGKLELNCTLELHGASSPEEVGKAIHIARNKIQTIISDMEENLRSARRYRRKDKKQEKQRKRLQKSHRRPSVRWAKERHLYML